MSENSSNPGMQPDAKRPSRSPFAEAPRILIVTGDNGLAKQLAFLFHRAGLEVGRVKSMTDACDSARSGLFQVVLSEPEVGDGSWKRLAELACGCSPSFVVIVLARNFDLHQWAQALEEGAFEVVDIVQDLSKTAEIARRAFWAAYLSGAELNPEKADPLRIS